MKSISYCLLQCGISRRKQQCRSPGPRNARPISSRRSKSLSKPARTSPSRRLKSTNKPCVWCAASNSWSGAESRRQVHCHDLANHEDADALFGSGGLIVSVDRKPAEIRLRVEQHVKKRIPDSGETRTKHHESSGPSSTIVEWSKTAWSLDANGLAFKKRSEFCIRRASKIDRVMKIWRFCNTVIFVKFIKFIGNYHLFLH